MRSADDATRSSAATGTPTWSLMTGNPRSAAVAICDSSSAAASSSGERAAGPTEQVDVASYRGGLEPQPGAEPPEGEDLVAVEVRVATPQLVADDLEPGAELERRRALEQLCVRVTTRQPLVREGERRRSQSHRQVLSIRIKVRIRNFIQLTTPIRQGGRPSAALAVLRRRAARTTAWRP